MERFPAAGAAGGRIDGKVARIVAALLFAGLALRVGYVMTLRDRPVHYQDPVEVSIGETLARTGDLVYPNFSPEALTRMAAAGVVPKGREDYARRTPLYPMLVALHVYFLRPDVWPLVLRLTQCLIGVLTCAGIWLLARRLGGEAVGLVALCLGAINPLFIWQDGAIGHQALLTCWLTWAMVFGVRKQGTYLQAVGAGLCFAGAAMTSGSTLLLMPAFLLVLLGGTKFGKKKRAAKDAAKQEAGNPAKQERPAPTMPRAAANRVMSVLVIAAATLAGVLPWGLRNCLRTPLGQPDEMAMAQGEQVAVLQGFVLGDTSMGIVLDDGNGASATGAPFPRRSPERRDVGGGQTERQFEVLHLNQALGSIRSDPLRALRLAGVKLVRMYSAFPNSPSLSEWPYRLIGAAWWLPLAAGAVFGLVLAVRRRWPAGLLLTVPIYLAVVHAVFVASISDRLGAEPAFIVLAALAVVRLFGGAARGLVPRSEAPLRRAAKEAGGDAA